jgi:predicted Zn-dependent peptidase
MTRDDLYNFYKKYYVPNNATVVAVGDFNADQLLERLQSTFGAIPRGQDVPALTIDEPEQAGERRVVVRRPGAAPYFMAAYKAPRATDPDFYATMMLAGVLSGASGLAMGLSATARPGVSLEKIEKAVFAELERIADKPITDHEYDKVLKQTRAQYVYAEDGVGNHGYRLGMLDIVASWRMYETFLENLENVTKDDVRRVAAKYLAESNRTVGWFVPSNQAAVNGARGKPKAKAKTKAKPSKKRPRK